ncbi:hypothetical protein C2W62_31525 [Candidatus Entotheonella serta]|nr:hypothetical protein C2W62_31525 [Candidatus Entotheonella serta]
MPDSRTRLPLHFSEGLGNGCSKQRRGGSGGKAAFRQPSFLLAPKRLIYPKLSWRPCGIIERTRRWRQRRPGAIERTRVGGQRRPACGMAALLWGWGSERGIEAAAREQRFFG